MTNTTIEKVSDDSAVRRKKKPATAEVAKKKTAAASKKATTAKKAMQQYGADSPQAKKAVEDFSKADADAATARVSAAKQPKPLKARKLAGDTQSVDRTKRDTSARPSPVIIEPTREAAAKVAQARVEPLAKIIQRGAQTPAEVTAIVRAIAAADAPSAAPVDSEAAMLVVRDIRQHAERVRQLKHLLSQPFRLEYHAPRSRPSGCLSNSEIFCINALTGVAQMKREAGIAIANAKRGYRQAR